MKFGVVTAVKDGRARFRACAASVLASAAAVQPASSADVRHFVRESAASRDTVEDFAAAAGCDFVRAPDGGLYDALGAGLDAACAAGCDVLAWLNADEQWLPAAVGAAQRVFESNPRLSLVFGDYLLLDAAGAPRAARREIPARLFYLRHGVNYLLSCTVFFRREVWERVRPFDLSYRLVADKKFYLSALGAGFRACLAPEYLAAFSVTGDNASLDASAAAAEQARLRAEAGAFRSPLARAAVRGLRVLDKAIHGCYFPDTVDVPLFAPDGAPRRVRSRLGPFWNWNRS